MERLHRPRLRQASAGLWTLAWLAVAALMLMPLHVPSAPPHADVLVHFVIFGSMALATVTFCHRAGPLTLMAVVTAAAATLLEVAQSQVPHRTFELVDLAANAAGTTAGYGLALVVLHWMIRPGDAGSALAASAIEAGVPSLGRGAHRPPVDRILVSGERTCDDLRRANPDRRESGDG